MSFDFGNNNISQFKTQAAYKDGGGMGGGGMYMRQGKKQKNEEEKDLFEFSNENEDSLFSSEIKEKDIPSENLINKFVNWFRIKK